MLQTDTAAAFLGVDCSATGRRWEARACDDLLAAAIAQRHHLPDVVARCVHARGIGLDEVPCFLNPRLQDTLPDPAQFKDMDKAVARFLVAVAQDQPVAIFGDYDVDGATSSALLLRFCRAVGVKPRLYVPDRLREGYGPNAGAMALLAGEGIRLVICVDCGTTAHDALIAAQAAGLDVIVLDHHATEAALPPAVAIVNPNRLDEDGAYGHLAAVGMTFLFAVAANRALREAGHYGDNRPEPDLRCYLDLVALGTICDVVRLTGLNRAFVAQGLKVAAQRRNAGIDALCRVAGARQFDAYAAGFLVGPRVNAGGRVGEAALGARLLASDDADTAAIIAQHLHELNARRREIEAETLREAESLTADSDLPLAFVARDGWHPGVIGIVAARLKDKYRRPAIVIAIDGEVGKGSGRSVGQVDLGAHILAAKQAGLLINGGGHKMAAGLTVARDRIGDLRDFLAERIGRQMRDEPLVPVLSIDGLLSVKTLTVDFVRQAAALGPFGTGNTEPRFALADCVLVKATVVGENHVSIVARQGGGDIRGIAFRALGTGLGELLLTMRHVHLAGYARVDEWQGVERVQLHIADAAAAI